MSGGEREDNRGGHEELRSLSGSYVQGLSASVRNNSSAYGFSVSITASFGLLTSVAGTPTVPEIFAFAAAAVVAFALVEFVVSGG